MPENKGTTPDNHALDEKSSAPPPQGVPVSAGTVEEAASPPTNADLIANTVFEKLRADANAQTLQSEYKHINIDTESLFAELKAGSNSIAIELKNLIKHIATNATKSCYRAADGNALHELIKDLFNPSSYPSKNQIKIKIESVLPDNKVPDKLLDPISRISRINERDQLAGIKKQVATDNSKLSKQLETLLQAAKQAVNNADRIESALLAGEEKDEKKDGATPLVTHPLVTQLKHLSEARRLLGKSEEKGSASGGSAVIPPLIDQIQECITNVRDAHNTFTKATNAAEVPLDTAREALATFLKTLGETSGKMEAIKNTIATIRTHLADANKASHPAMINTAQRERLKAAAVVEGATDNVKNEAAFAKEIFETYDKLYRLKDAALSGDASAHAKMTEAKEIIGNISKTLKRKVADGAGAGRAVLSDDLSTEMKDWVLHYDQLEREVSALSEKPFAELGKERIFSPRASSGSTAEYQMWAAKFNVPTAGKVAETQLNGRGATLAADKTELEIVAGKEFTFYPPANEPRQPQDSVFYTRRASANKSYEFTVLDLPESISDRHLFFLFLQQYSPEKSDGTKFDRDGKDLKALIYQKMPPKITKENAADFMEKFAQISTRTSAYSYDTIAKHFIKFMDEKRSSRYVLAKSVDNKKVSFQKGWFGGRKEIEMPNKEIMDAARIYLDTLNASGQTSVTFDECSNKQLVIAMKLLAHLYQDTLKCKIHFPVTAPEPTPDQIQVMLVGNANSEYQYTSTVQNVVRAGTARVLETVKSGNSGVFEKGYIDGLTTQADPIEALRAGHALIKKAQTFDLAAAATKPDVKLRRPGG